MRPTNNEMRYSIWSAGIARIFGVAMHENPTGFKVAVQGVGILSETFPIIGFDYLRFFNVGDVHLGSFFSVNVEDRREAKQPPSTKENQ